MARRLGRFRSMPWVSRGSGASPEPLQRRGIYWETRFPRSFSSRLEESRLGLVLSVVGLFALISEHFINDTFAPSSHSESGFRMVLSLPNYMLSEFVQSNSKWTIFFMPNRVCPPFMPWFVTAAIVALPVPHCPFFGSKIFDGIRITLHRSIAFSSSSA